MINKARRSTSATVRILLILNAIAFLANIGFVVYGQITEPVTFNGPIEGDPVSPNSK